MDKVEKLARILCAARGDDPEVQVVEFEPARASGVHGYVIPDGAARPAWWFYLWAAKSAIEAGFDYPDDPAPIETLSDEEISAVTDSASVSGDFHASEDFPAPSDGSAWRERLNRMGLTHGDG